MNDYYTYRIASSFSSWSIWSVQNWYTEICCVLQRFASVWLLKNICKYNSNSSYKRNYDINFVWFSFSKGWVSKLFTQVAAVEAFYATSVGPPATNNYRKNPRIIRGFFPTISIPNFHIVIYAVPNKNFQVELEVLVSLLPRGYGLALLFIRGYGLASFAQRGRESPAMLCKMIADTWASIPENLVSRSFKKCGISNAFDGTEDEYL